MGIAIPRFCDHPLLAPAGACRQCLVDVEGQRKPVASCTQTVADGMVVKTQLTSPVAAKAQAGVMELLLMNHPLDCPMCDKGGECPLQNQAMSTGRTDSRFHEEKRTYEKPINISSQVLLDRERCVLCQRCTRFSEEIAGDKFIDLMERSSAEQIGVYRDAAFEHPRGHDTIDETAYPEGEPESGDVEFNSYFSGNTVQICPVGALTGAQYRFRARPFDLVSTPSACEHCAAGCAQRTDHRRGKVHAPPGRQRPAGQRRVELRQGPLGLPVRDRVRPAAAPAGARREDRRAARGVAGPRRCSVAAEGLRRARTRHGVGVLTGGRLTVEDAYAYAKFTRVVLGTNDIDFRARPVSDEETAVPGLQRGRRRRRDLRRRRQRDRGRDRRPGAGGGVPDPVPAAAQAVTARKLPVLRGRAVRLARLREARRDTSSCTVPGHEAEALATERRRSPTRWPPSAAADRRRAAGHGAPGAVRRGRAGRADRREARLGAAPRR